MKDKLTTFRLKPTTIEYLNKLADDYNSNRTAMLELILEAHQKTSSSEIDLIADKVVDKIDERYKNMFTRLRLATNFSEQNIQIIMEMLNSMIIFQAINKTCTTDIFESEILLDSKRVVKERISHYKQKKDNKKGKCT